MSGNATIRVWGYGYRGQDYILTLLNAWEADFRRAHPETHFDNKLDGDASAIGGLFTDSADIAILDREADFVEVDAYRQGAGFDPFHIAVAGGSVATAHHAPALRIYVNPANPISRLTLQQLDGIFDADHKLAQKRYRTWGDLGLAGAWTGRPIHIYTYPVSSSEMKVFEHAAMNNSQKFSCCMTTYEGMPGPIAETQISRAVMNDRYGLAMIAADEPRLKPVALSVTEEGADLLPTAATLAAGIYPLARTIYFYVKRPPHAPVPPNVAAFLSYVVSSEGQAVVIRTGFGYLPLPPAAAEQAREALK